MKAHVGLNRATMDSNFTLDTGMEIAAGWSTITAGTRITIGIKAVTTTTTRTMMTTTTTITTIITRNAGQQIAHLSDGSV